MYGHQANSGVVTEVEIRLSAYDAATRFISFLLLCFGSLSLQIDWGMCLFVLVGIVKSLDYFERVGVVTCKKEVVEVLSVEELLPQRVFSDPLHEVSPHVAEEDDGDAGDVLDLEKLPCVSITMHLAARQSI